MCKCSGGYCGLCSEGGGLDGGTGSAGFDGVGSSTMDGFAAVPLGVGVRGTVFFATGTALAGFGAWPGTEGTALALAPDVLLAPGFWGLVSVPVVGFEPGVAAAADLPGAV